MMKISIETLRPFTENDYEAYVAFLNRVRPGNSASVERLRHADTHRQENEYSGRFLLERDASIIAATFYTRDMNFLSRQAFFLNIVLDPAYQALNEALYRQVVGEMGKYDPTSLRVRVREDWERWRSLYDAHGFAEVERMWHSVLDLTAFNATPFSWAVDKAKGAGITFKRLVELPDDEATQRQVYNTTVEILQDVPFSEPLEIWSFELWQERYWSLPERNPETHFLAFDGNELVGVSELRRGTTDDRLSTGLTGIRRTWRRLGIAQALKVQAAQYAHAQGFKAIDTTNHSVNRPMLSINEAMGFEKEPAWIFLQKELEGNS